MKKNINVMPEHLQVEEKFEGEKTLSELLLILLKGRTEKEYGRA